jgi:hypothetical protein
MMDSSQIGLTTLAATQGIVLFTSLCPDRSSLYKAHPDLGTRQNLRQGELVATVLTLGFAGALAFYTKSQTPLLLAGATVVTMVTAYEYTLHMTPIGE